MSVELAHQRADKHLCVALHRKLRKRLHPFMELNCGITSNDEKQVALLGILFYPHNNPNAYFIKQVERNGN